jgi:hypothetical protein
MSLNVFLNVTHEREKPIKVIEMNLLVIIILTLINGLFAMSEMALGFQ